jgi:fucose permease
MATLFLMIIYMAFISLGLPDSLLGTAWPIMQIEYEAPLEMAGLISMMISAGTIISSLMSGKVIKRFGTGKVTFISCFMTAGALLGIALAPHLFWFFILAIPLGVGAGAVDSGLNNYVALHYKAHHMSWLHCFWGVGATCGPIIMSWYMVRGESWRSGYMTVAIIQFVLVILLFITLPLWGKVALQSKQQSDALRTDAEEGEDSSDQKNLSEVQPIHIKGVKFALTAFFFYCGIEATMGLWGSSFLVNIKGLDAALAAKWVSFYYGGITVGRFITGFITMKMSNKMLIRIGQSMSLGGIILLVLPLPNFFSLISFILIGLGCAPVFPCMIHETPIRFGKEHSQTIIGYQMACAYVGITFLPPLLGWIAARTTIGILPFLGLIYILGMLISSEKINELMKKRQV